MLCMNCNPEAMFLHQSRRLCRTAQQLASQFGVFKSLCHEDTRSLSVLLNSLGLSVLVAYTRRHLISNCPRETVRHSSNFKAACDFQRLEIYHGDIII